jgi:hypothetical protein
VNIDASKSTGALFGTYVGQLICASLEYFGHIPVSTQTSISIAGVCIFLASHFFPTSPQSGAKATIP